MSVETLGVPPCPPKPTVRLNNFVRCSFEIIPKAYGRRLPGCVFSNILGWSGSQPNESSTPGVTGSLHHSQTALHVQMSIPSSRTAKDAQWQEAVEQFRTPKRVLAHSGPFVSQRGRKATERSCSLLALGLPGE